MKRTRHVLRCACYRTSRLYNFSVRYSEGSPAKVGVVTLGGDSAGTNASRVITIPP